MTATSVRKIYGKGFIVRVYDDDGRTEIQTSGGTKGRVDKAVGYLLKHRPAPQAAFNLLRGELSDLVESTTGWEEA